ncbi:penicillin-binding protein 2 [Peribacillus saganii]|uniref:serine-type D-Ala-D-Ala carboxypeptidase n=1 Tax=Peribacillus saganii TaxID=2303992 RepID=A0A372LDX7_9BACI|nr:penicillin-binding protein 2 [Peribacillus saganii]RFU64295.1 penicillin-binding protein 2 [Peribacillus saganii]
MKKKKKKKTHVPVRLNLLFFVVFLLFSILVLRLGVVQIVYGEDYRREIERTEDITVNNPVPRGKMFERNGKIIVDNVPLDAITYTRYQGTKTEEMLETAEKLAKYIDKDTEKITERDKQDFWILKNPVRAEAKIKKKELKMVAEEKLTQKDLYKLQRNRITQAELNEFSAAELEVLAIFRELNSSKSLTPKIIKNKNVTREEFAVVSEHLEELPGIDITTDWDRKYAFGETLKSVLGKVSSSEEGLPNEQLDYFLARDYSRNDRVGKSYIEMQYEDVLHGQKAKVKNRTDKAGNIIESIPISDGERGKDIVLTVDMDLQLTVEKIIEKQLKEKKSHGNTQFLEYAYVTIMNPNTGEILAMAGKRYYKDEKGKWVMEDNALGNLASSYTVGSTVKGATVLTGYKTGATKPGQTRWDRTLRIKGTPDKGSYKDLGSINDTEALKLSSNVYMFLTAIDIAGSQYIAGQPLRIPRPRLEDTYSIMRNSFSQFGLGTRTGIDLPNEMAGFKGPVDGGKLLDLAIGQYDTYTPLQLAQYVSTIANGGNRMKPHIVKEIRQPIDDKDTLGPVIQEMPPVVLNRLDMKPAWIERVQTGFKRVTQEKGGTAYKWFGDKSYSPAGKTGTAESFYDGPKRKNYKEPPPTINLSFVAYAPSNAPEIALSVVVPWAYQGQPAHNMNKEIGAAAMDAYFNLKKQRAQQQQSTQSTEEKVTGPDAVLKVPVETEGTTAGEESQNY